MRTLDVILLLLGFACFVVSAVVPGKYPRLVPLGLAAWICVPLIAAFQHVD